MNAPSDRVTTLEPSAVPQRPAAPAGPTATRAGLRQALPTLLVLLTLGGLFGLGHYTGWTIPKFSELTGNGSADSDDWCGEHSVPESRCVECKPDLLPRVTFGWCKEHGVHDCPLCHPEVAQLKDRPQITPADRERARRALDFAERPKNDSGCKLHPRRIQFASREAIDKQGIRTDQAWPARVEEVVTANGEVTYDDQKRVASLASLVPGRVWRVEKELGQPVRKNEVLALVEAAEVGKAKAEFLQAVAQVVVKSQSVEAMRPAYEKGAIAAARFREEEAALQEAHIRLVSAQQALVNLGLPIRAEDVQALPPDEIGRRIQFLGLTDSVVRTLDPQTTTANLLPIRSPLDGEVVDRKAKNGEVVDPSKPLFVVADTGQMRLTLHVRLEDMTKHLAVGKPVRFRPDGGGEAAPGKVAWISPAVDEKTRTVEVRADLPNADGRLRAYTFGRGTIVLRVDDQAITVPNEAVHWDGRCHVVFVWDKDSGREDTPKVFHARSVRPGVKGAERTEIIAGVLPGEMVATTNSGVLRAQLLRANLGEG